MDVGWNSRRAKGASAVVALLSVCLVGVALPASASAIASPPDAGAAAVIARYQVLIPKLMAEQGIPGLAIAIVDGDDVLWAEGFGSTERGGGRPVTTDTMFSVQSMSKLFTATAVMQAVGAGRLDLDAPITTYLPEFTVHSAFEAQPERKITLRMLLSHTAGFTHEAPIGNNYDLDPGTFEAHVRSISDTWLRFPVGTGYAYSNLGIDLAGYILERVSGKAFAQVMEESLLGPLGMDHSTFERERIRATADRAIGHAGALADLPVDVPMTAAGGLYTSAADLANFLRFQLGDGTIGGVTLVDADLITEMRTVPKPHPGASAGYALGVARTHWRAGRYLDLFSHGGGGFGFLSDLWWLPQLQLGIAVLTNSSEHDLQGDLALSVLRDLVNEPGSEYHRRLLAQPTQADVVDTGRFEPPLDMARSVAAAAMPPAGDDLSRWAACVGSYEIESWGVLDPTVPADRFRRGVRGTGLLRAERHIRPRPPPARRGRARSLPGRRRRDAGLSRSAAHLAEPAARSRAGRPIAGLVAAARRGCGRGRGVVRRRGDGCGASSPTRTGGRRDRPDGATQEPPRDGRRRPLRRADPRHVRHDRCAPSARRRRVPRLAGVAHPDPPPAARAAGARAGDGVAGRPLRGGLGARSLDTGPGSAAGGPHRGGVGRHGAGRRLAVARPELRLRLALRPRGGSVRWDGLYHGL